MKWYRRNVPHGFRMGLGYGLWLFAVLPIFLAEGIIRGAAEGWRDAVELVRKARAGR